MRADAPPVRFPWHRGAAPLVALAAAASHLPALWAGFTWLDHGDLEHGAAIAPPGQWLHLFAHGYARTGFYRPLTALSLSIDALAGAPWVFHLTSVLLHALAAVLVLFAAEALGLRRRAALMSALLFAVHPVASSMVVDQLAGRTDLLAAVGLFTLLIACAQKRPLLAFAAMAMAGLSKETALVLGPAIALIAAPDAGRRFERFNLGALAGWLVAMGLRLAFAPRWNAQPLPLGKAEAAATRFGSLAKSLYVLIVPDTRVCDAFPILGATDWAAWAGAIAGVFLCVVALKKRGPWVLALLCLLPSLALVPVPRFWSPHYLYLPFAFLAMAVASAVDRFDRAGVAVLSAVAVLWAAVSLRTAMFFHDDRSLFAREVEGRPYCREAQLYLGDDARARGDLNAAADAYVAASAPTPGYLSYSDEAAALQNLGLVRLSQGRFNDAERAFRDALGRQSGEVERRQLRHDLAAALIGEGELSSAERLLREEAAMPDAMAESVELLARVLAAQHREDEANAVLSDAQARGILKR